MTPTNKLTSKTILTHAQLAKHVANIPGCFATATDLFYVVEDGEILSWAVSFDEAAAVLNALDGGRI